MGLGGTGMTFGARGAARGTTGGAETQAVDTARRRVQTVKRTM
jgi:hypothetical protein